MLTRMPICLRSSCNSVAILLSKIATLLQDDLKQIGMRVNIVSMDFRSMLDRLLQTYDYDAAIMGLGGGDADPNPEVNVWSTSGTMHLWHLGQASAAQDW